MVNKMNFITIAARRFSHLPQGHVVNSVLYNPKFLASFAQLKLNDSGFRSGDFSCGFLSNNVQQTRSSRNVPIEAPSHPLAQKIEFFDPKTVQNELIFDLPRNTIIAPMIDQLPAWQNEVSLPPTENQAPAMEAGGPRGGYELRMRHRRMKKHWRMKHFKRDIVIYRKRERRRKMAAEKVFRDKLDVMICEAENFDAKKYVEDFLAKVQWGKSSQTSLPMSAALISEDSSIPTVRRHPYTDFGLQPQLVVKKAKPRKPFQHWTEIISVEQLFGLPPSKRIDKKAGKPHPEEMEEISEQKRKYEETFRKIVKKNDEKN